jgi:hypothetical protein
MQNYTVKIKRCKNLRNRDEIVDYRGIEVYREEGGIGFDEVCKQEQHEEK